MGKSWILEVLGGDAPRAGAESEPRVALSMGRKTIEIHFASRTRRGRSAIRALETEARLFQVHFGSYGPRLISQFSFHRGPVLVHFARTFGLSWVLC